MRQRRRRDAPAAEGGAPAADGGAPVAEGGAPAVSLPLRGPLVESCFVERPNRFLLHCATGDGSVQEAHMADPGRLKELLLPGQRVWLRRAVPGPARRTHWTAVLVEAPDGAGLVSIDTTLPNRLIRMALLAGTLEEFAGWELERHEATLGRSRIDFVLRRADSADDTPAAAASRGNASRRGGSGKGKRRTRAPRLALEVKSVTLVEDDVGLFPDAVTARGARHVRELAALAREDDWEAAVLFVLQRPDAHRIEAAAAIDPVFAHALAEAKAAGVRVYGRRCHVSLEALTLGDAVPAG